VSLTLFVTTTQAITTTENTAAKTSPPALKLAVYPYTHTSRVVPAWTPLADYLQQHLQQPVVVVSAPSHAAFAQRAEAGDYFLYITAPHMAAWLDQQGQACRVRKILIPLYGQLWVTKTSGYRGLNELAGKTIATMARGSLVAELLDYQGAILRDQRPFDFTIQYNPSHVSAVRAVLNGTADAAYVVPLPVPQLIGPDFESIVIVERSKLTTHAMFMTPAGLGHEHAEKMGRLLDDFQSNDDKAQTMFTPYLYSTPTIFEPILDSDIENLIPLANQWHGKLN